MDRYAFAVAAGLAVSLAGCGSSPNPSPSPPPPPPPPSPPPSSSTTTTAATTTTTPPKSTCVKPTPAQGTWCVVKDGTPAASVNSAKEYVCGDGGLDCSGCGANDTLIFNSYFQAHIGSGNVACDFGGAGQLIQPTGSPCLPSIENRKWCQPKANASADDLQVSLEYACNNGVNCAPINPGGKCVFPPKTDLESKAHWAFNSFYQSHLATDGDAGCDFSGEAELVWAPCGEENNGNAESGVGYAYADKAACVMGGPDTSGCIQVDGAFNGCRHCVTKTVADNPEPFCPWASPSPSGGPSAPLAMAVSV